MILNVMNTPDCASPAGPLKRSFWGKFCGWRFPYLSLKKGVLGKISREASSGVSNKTSAVGKKERYVTVCEGV
jgi:hypothetical protein